MFVSPLPASVTLASPDSDPVQGFAGLAAKIAFGALVLGLIALTMRKQRGADDLVSNHGWIKADPGSVDPPLGQALPNVAFQGGTRSQLVTGSWRRWPAERFQWHAAREKEVGTQTWVETIRLPGELEALNLRPIGNRPKGIAFIATDRDSLSREFLKYWYVDDPGGEAANVLTEPVMRVLLADEAPRVPVSIAGNTLFTRRTTWRQAHRGVEGRLDFLTRIAEAIPQRAYEAVREDESTALEARLAPYPYPGKPAPLGLQSSKNMLGFFSILLAMTWMLAPVGIILAVMGWRAARQGLATNRGMIIVGFVLSIAATMLLLVGLIAAIAQ